LVLHWTSDGEDQNEINKIIKNIIIIWGSLGWHEVVMNTKNSGREEVSALVDNELPGDQMESALTTVYADGRATWDIYHQIGDLMRSDEMGHAFSTDFSARMSARLAAEPAIVAPISHAVRIEQSPPGNGRGKQNTLTRRFAIPVMAVAVAAVAVITNPRLLTPPQGAAAVAVTPVNARLQPTSNYALVASSAPADGVNTDAAVKDGVILRDPRIDEYLLAHQRFSPSLYSTAQYARMAPFVSESNK
jgi:sigma-E factor negative regulatory protein RseA